MPQVVNNIVPLFTADESNGSIYYVGVNAHVIQVWDNNGSFGENDLNALTGAPNVGSTSLISAVLATPCCNGSVFFIGVDQHVHQIWFNGHWGQNDLGVLTGAPNAIAGSPLIATSTASGSNGAVFYFASDGHIHQIWFNGHWGQNDLGALADAPNPASNSSLVASFTPDQSVGSLYYVGGDKHIHQIWFNGNWGQNDLSALTGAPGPGNSNAMAAQLSSPCCNSAVFYIDSNQHVQQIWYNGNWGRNDLGALTGAPNASSGSPLALTFIDSGSNGAVFYFGVDGHIHQIWFNGNWGQNDLNALTGASNPAGSGISAQLSTPCCNSSVFYTGTDKQVHQIWYNGSWGRNDFGSLVGAPNAIAGSPIGASFLASGASGAVFYIDVHQHLDQIWNNGHWGETDLGALTSATNALP